MPGGVVNLSNDLLRSLIHKWVGKEPKSGTLFLVGLRGVVPAGPASVKRADDRVDAYNDTIVVAGSAWGLYRGSVDPGLYYTVNPMDPDGCAHLVGHDDPDLKARPKRAYEYQRGSHRGHAALVQAAGVNLRRDRDRDGRDEAGEPLELNVWKGVNIHAGGSSEKVGPNSAGCQVIWGGWQGQAWGDFYAKVLKADQAAYLYHLFGYRSLGR